MLFQTTQEHDQVFWNKLKNTFPKYLILEKLWNTFFSEQSFLGKKRGCKNPIDSKNGTYGGEACSLRNFSNVPNIVYFF